MGIEELCIRKIESGIRALKFKSKKPSELNLSQYFEKLKKTNEGMHDDLFEKYRGALKIYKESFENVWQIKKEFIPLQKQKLNKMEEHWIHYDRTHLMNTENGMIVVKGTDLNNIKPEDIKGFDYL